MNLATLGPPPLDGDVEPSGIALGADDTFVVGISVLGSGGTNSEVIIALSPETAQPRWTQSFTGSMLGGPIVAPDGSIVIVHLTGAAGPAEFVLLDPTTGQIRRRFDVPGTSLTVFGLSAIGLDGTFLAESDEGQGVDRLLALTPTGTVLWRNKLQVLDATITADGSVLAHDSFDLTLLDLATGTTKWILAPPHPGICISEAELTSAGSIVGLQCDGTLFGAAD